MGMRERSRRFAAGMGSNRCAARDKMASLTQLRYALAVARHRNFRRAAAACFVSQPTLSTQLRKLEEELEISLFDRSRKPVAPTSDGVQLLDEFRRVVHAYEHTLEVARDLRGVVGGIYRLGIIPTMAPYLLPLLLPRFGEAFP
ncbi:MAG TPA: LysR family transcriptional regulator, partial [Polyangiaceae bacterium]|nr:LysR family transcriptional regulator [Polyangiaceae bacterium]